MNTPIVRFLGIVAWLITALAAINIGLKPWGYDFFASSVMVTKFPSLIIPLHYAIGAAGLISLLMFLMATTSSRCACGCHPSQP